MNGIKGCVQKLSLTTPQSASNHEISEADLGRVDGVTSHLPFVEDKRKTKIKCYAEKKANFLNRHLIEISNC